MITHYHRGTRPVRVLVGVLGFSGWAHVAAGAPAQEGVGAAAAQVLSLDEAVARALRASPQLLAAQAQARAARESSEGASSGRLPRIEGELGWSRTDHPVYVFGSLLAQERFGPENFGTFNPSTGQFDLSVLNTPPPESNFRAAISVYQPIWTGGALTSGIGAAQAQAEAAHGAAQRTAEQIAYDTERAFRMALLAEDQVQVLRASLDVARSQSARVESLWTAGLALQSDRRALDAHVSEMTARLAGARADSAEARSGLGLLLGAGEPITDTLLEPQDEMGFSAPAFDDALAAATGRADVRAAQAGARAAGSLRGVTLAELLPMIGVMAGAEHNSESFLGDGGDQWMLGVSARWRFDLGSTDRMSAAGARAEAAERAYELTRDHAAHEVRVAYDRLQAAEDRKAALDDAVEFAEESYRLIEERYREGLATVLELNEFQNTLVRTRLGAVSARHELALARSAVLLAAGSLVDSEESR